MTKTKIINFCRLIAPSNFPINYLYRLSNDVLMEEVFPRLKEDFINKYNTNHKDDPIQDIQFVLVSKNEADEHNMSILLGDDLSARTIGCLDDSVAVMGRCAPIVSYKDDLIWKVKGVR